MPVFGKLYGLSASNRTEEEKKAINEQKAYREDPKDTIAEASKPSTKLPDEAKIDVEAMKIAQGDKDALARQSRKKAQILTQRMKEFKALYKENAEKYGVNRNSENLTANQLIDNISKKYSSYYKKYYGTEKLPEWSVDKKKLAAEYDTILNTQGEDRANTWLDDQYKNIVASNQSWWEQALNSFTHYIPTIEGGAVQVAGNLYGLIIDPALKFVNSDWGMEDNEDLSGWGNYWDHVLDNPATRLGSDIERSGASYVVQSIMHPLGLSSESASERIANTKATATKYNPEGIADDAIVTSTDQEAKFFTWSTPWQANYSGGFTALSMLTGQGLAKASTGLFADLAKGATYVNRTGKLLKTEESLMKSLKVLKKFQQGVNAYVVPALVGSTEGALEGLQTKKQVEQDGIRNLDDFYKQLVEQEVEVVWGDEQNKPATYTKVKDEKGGERLVKTGGKNKAQIYQEVWNKYKDEYMESRRQIEIAASKAGQYNFWANSIINGALNATLKAGLQAANVQEAIRNSRLLGWAYRSPGFEVVGDEVRRKGGKLVTALGTAKRITKELAGEGLEEYLQSVSNDMTSGGAENNITEFITAKFDGNANVKVGDTFSSEFGAAMNAAYNSLTSKNSIDSAILGALGSAIGTVHAPGRSYYRGEDNKLHAYNLFSPKNFKRNLNAQGEQESIWDMTKRLTPWRSSIISAYRERKRELDEADETAKFMTEWLRDPKNREKWDGLTGTAYWLDQMYNASESNDKFSYRRAEMGKAINDAVMLSKMKGTDFYETLVKQLQTSASMDVTSEEGQNIINSVKNALGEEYENKSDDEIIDMVKSNANKMLGIMSEVEKESDNLDGQFGRMDEDTKQSLIYGKIMRDHFAEMKEEYEARVNRAKGEIQNSRSNSNVTLDDEQKALIAKHGTIRQAINNYKSLEKRKQKAEEKVKELEAIDSSKRSDKQNEELKAKKEEVKAIDKRLKEDFVGLNQKNEKGKRISGTIDESLDDIVLSEQDIMNLDAETRAMMLAQGSAKFYNATHQNRKAIDALNQEISEIQEKIDALEEKKKKWSDANGRVRKGHNKQVIKANKAIEKLEKDKAKKERDLRIEKGELEAKPVYSEAQQQVIDNILQQGSMNNSDFLDDVVDLARYEKSIKDYYKQMLDIYTDPKSFQKYVQKAKYNAMLDIAKRRASWVASIEDYKEFAKELDRLTANASEAELFTIFNTLRQADDKRKAQHRKEREERETDNLLEEEGQENNQENTQENNQEGDTVAEEENSETRASNEESTEESTEETTSVENEESTEEKKTSTEEEETLETESKEEEEETNFEKYLKNQSKQEEIIAQLSKNKSLTSNDISLIVDALQYLQQNGIDVTNREEAVEALLEKDDAGNLGGKFREWVELKNEGLPKQQRAHMPVYTSIGQIVSQYVEALNEREVDLENAIIVNPTIAPIEIENAATDESPSQEETPREKEKKSLLHIGGKTAESGHIIDGNGTVATDAVAEEGKKEADKKAAEESKKELGEEEELSDVEKAFRKITTPQIAKTVNITLENLLRSIQFAEEGKKVGITEKEKDMVRKALVEVAENAGETLDTMEEVIDEILSKADYFQQMQDMMAEENDGALGHISITLKRLTRTLNAQNKRNRGVDKKEKRPASPTSARIHTADISYLEQKYPDAWAVKFTNEHAIDEYNRSHTFSPTDRVFFITNSEWTAEVTRQMSDNKNGKTYDTLTNMPIVIAVEVETPKNVDTTTAIEVAGKWYQPIGVLPSSTSKVDGAERTVAIRQLASKEQGTHLITEDGLPNSYPLISKVNGKNYIDAFHPDGDGSRRVNSKENNTDIQDNLLKMLPEATAMRLAGMSKQEMLNDPEYIAARTRFINRLSWGEGYTGGQNILNNQVLYTPDDLKHNEGKPSDTHAQPIVVSVKPMAKTTARESDATLPEVLENGSVDDVITFNSITQKLYSQVIRPLVEYLPVVDRGKDDISARVVTVEDDFTLEDEAQRLTKQLVGYTGEKETKGINGLSNYIHISKHSEWNIQVVVDRESSFVANPGSAVSVYNVVLKHANDQGQIFLGTIRATAQQGEANKINIENAKNILKNLLRECTTGVLKEDASWQNSKTSILNLANEEKAPKARKALGTLVDDGIFELWGSTLEYTVKGLYIQAPVSMEGKIQYPYPRSTVSNSDNASTSASGNASNEGQGAIVTGNGKIIEEGSGAELGNQGNMPNSPQGEKSAAEERAEAMVKKIVQDSSEFTLSKDETYYYIKDKTTGQEVKYLRVTTVIGADENVTQYYPTEEEWKEQLGISEFDQVAQILINDMQERKDPKEQKEAWDTFVQYITNNKEYGISKESLVDALGNARTNYKKTKFGLWGTPSTAIGNTADIIVRDYLAGELKDSYPNVSKEVLTEFKTQLDAFKKDLAAKGIKLVSKNVMAHGKITVTAEDGSTYDVNVAGTLDLLGYDKNGNFYIFDMKTTRDHSKEKLLQEKAKWSRQISMYADLLKQSYPGFEVSANNLRIIPINVGYKNPRSKNSPTGLVYSMSEDEEKKGQLQYTDRDGVHDFTISNPSDFAMRSSELDGQFQPGYTPLNINWDYLSSEDQEIAGVLREQSPAPKEGESTPKSAEIITPEKKTDGDFGTDELYNDGTLDGGLDDGMLPIASNLPSWEQLPGGKKGKLALLGILSEAEYNNALRDPALAKAIENMLKC